MRNQYFKKVDHAQCKDIRINFLKNDKTKRSSNKGYTNNIGLGKEKKKCTISRCLLPEYDTNKVHFGLMTYQPLMVI